MTIEVPEIPEGTILPENAILVGIKIGKKYTRYGLDIDEHKDHLEGAIEFLIATCVGRALELQGRKSDHSDAL